MVGTGYVGLVSGACFSEIGHEVVCVDVNEDKINKLKDGISPIYEPGLEKLIRQNQDHGRLFFTNNLQEALAKAEIAFIAVGTPPGENGEADLKYVENVAKEISLFAKNDLLVIVKSTVPVGSCDRVETIITENLRKRKEPLEIHVASNPEFLKEGNAIADFMKPDRIVVGLKKQSTRDRDKIKRLYKVFSLDDPSKLLIVERKSSEMIKYAANAMLATRISFMNELSLLCEKLKVNIDQVRLGLGSDPRVGKKFLYAGPGYGGSCFPKDVSALVQTGKKHNLDLQILNAVTDANQKQKELVSKKIINYFKEDLSHKKIAVWGLSFKPGTDDVREAPALHIIKRLLDHGATITAHDPQGQEEFQREFGSHKNLSYSKYAYEALNGAHALVLITEWSEYRFPNWQKVAQLLKEKAVFDLRNQYDPEQLIDLGFHYQCIGRPDSITNI